MFRVLAILLLLVGAPCAAHAQEIKIDAKLSTPDNLQLSIRNSEPLSPVWKYGVRCSTYNKGVMTLIGIYEDRVLVLYKVPGSMSNIIWCPNGVISFISKAEWHRAMRETEKQRADESNAEKDRPIGEKLLREYLRK